MLEKSKAVIKLFATQQRKGLQVIQVVAFLEELCESNDNGVLDQMLLDFGQDVL